MTLTELTQHLGAAKQRKAAIQDVYEMDIKNVDAEILRLTQRMNIANAGLDEEMVKRGMVVISFGDVKGIPERMSCVRDALDDLAGNATSLKHEYFGTKNYAHWSDQRCDCAYGYGPSHGSIVFHVGLNHDYRGKDLTPDDIECAIYCLLNIDKINEQMKQPA
ncbi:hypothetical protein [Pantoea sp. PNT03]|uniref:hypothetical protein n=1 Tax=Pantoea sp. PNT03 TaxID=2769258 RepID=UPI00177E087D|nr:hypothetical protein [Pantoea sp. PNT03]MBD9658079.1 hypothetical protein [Pantoea sp. PNT03]